MPFLTAVLGLTKLQALVYDILPPAIAITDYAIVIGLRKLEQRRPSAYQSSALPLGQTDARGLIYLPD